MPVSIFASDYYDDLGNLKKTSINPEVIPFDGGGTWKITVPPAIELFTLAELKTFARLDGTSEDALLTLFIKAARELTEKYLGRSLLARTIVYSMNVWPPNVIQLPMPPLMEVCEVRTLDEDDVVTVYSADDYYYRNIPQPGELRIRKGSAAPINTERDYGGFEIEYIAGYGDLVTDVPESIITGIKHWATYINENRNPGDTPPPSALPWLKPYKVVNI